MSKTKKAPALKNSPKSAKSGTAKNRAAEKLRKQALAEIQARLDAPDSLEAADDATSAATAAQGGDEGPVTS